MSLLCGTVLIVLSLVALVQSALDISYGNDSDLLLFHSRPDIRLPKLDVKLHDRHAVSPGYFFVAPYTDIMQTYYLRNYCMTLSSYLKVTYQQLISLQCEQTSRAKRDPLSTMPME